MSKKKAASVPVSVRGQACVLERDPAPEWLSAAARRKLLGFQIRCGDTIVGRIHGRAAVLRDVCGRAAKARTGAVCERGLDMRARIVRIGMVETAVGWERAGVATKLYEAMAKAACAQGRQVVSDERLRDSHSHAFWAKQLRKGRVTPLGQNGYGPIYALRCDAAADLSGIRRRRRA
jgi:hypothetical protein